MVQAEWRNISELHKEHIPRITSFHLSCLIYQTAFNSKYIDWRKKRNNALTLLLTAFYAAVFENQRFTGCGYCAENAFTVTGAVIDINGQY